MQSKYSTVMYAFPVFCLGLCLSGCSRSEGTKGAAGKLIFGGTEQAEVLETRIPLMARMDTGATTSSLHAENIQRFVKEGRQWVRFSVLNPESGQAVEVERPLTRLVAIKQHGRADILRPVVELPIRIGALERQVEFSLADRGKFEYPVLVGRNLMAGSMVIDVSLDQCGGLPLEGYLRSSEH